MRNHYEDQVVAAVRAVSIRSPVAYSWFGQPSESWPRAVRSALPPPVAREYLLHALQSRLYQDFYCKGGATPAEPNPFASVHTADVVFVALLSAANLGQGRREQGWVVHTMEADEVVVHKNGLSLWVRRNDCLTPDSEVLSPGASVSLCVPKELPDRAPGFYTVLGNEETSAGEDGGVVRLYWNLNADGAAEFVRSVTTLLNETGVPFHLKIVDHPERFTRCDAAVLYLPRASYHAIAELLPRIYYEIAQYLKPATPVFAKELAPGLGLAEDPSNGDSFGWNRCRMLADALIRAYEQGLKSESERVKAVAERFSAEGIGLDMPYLNPGSSDVYGFNVSDEYVPREGRTRHVGSEARYQAETFLDVALGIGRRLSQEAVWHLDQCNWIGFAPTEPRMGSHQPGMTYSALGPELYSGTSGIAFFCAELHNASGDAEMRRLALGAIRHALARVEVVRPQERLGLFTGWGGISLAAAHVGRLLKIDELIEQASELSSGATDVWPEEREFDLLLGNAGAIVAFLSLRAILPEEKRDLLDASVCLGDALLRTAITNKAGCSWRSVELRNSRNLTGFSHGTAGVAYALLELFAATGEPKYRQTALRAFDYERYWFDAAAGNWPDFRGSAGRARNTARLHQSAMAWCHGAPGIALSRLRAYELLRDEMCKAEAIIGLNTTRKALEKSFRYHAGNWSLCHGFAGNADVLLHGERVLDSQSADWKATVLEVAVEGLHTYARSGHRWPCGAGGGETPSLMLGLAGIGHFYLRLHNPNVPSILLLRPDDFLHRPK
jgi:hypothetical protein